MEAKGNKMDNGYFRVVWLIPVVVLVFMGCQRQYKEEVVEELARGPGIENISVPADYAVRAIEAAGGWSAWAQTKEIQLDGVVTFYQPDGSCYLTEQQHIIYPWSNSIQISAQEPQGRFVWQLSGGRFDVLQQDKQKINTLPIALDSSRFVEMILTIVTIPARLLDASARFNREATEFRIQGQLFYPITRRTKPFAGSGQPLSGAIFYQDRDSSLINMLMFTDADFSFESSMTAPIAYAIRGYDYEEVEEEGVNVPTRIEIFKTDARGNLQKRLVKIDYHALNRIK